MKPLLQRGFDFWSPDEIAETTIGLTSALCRRLWASLKEMPSPMSSFECDDRAAYMESNELRNVWDFFTPEEQQAINVHAEIYEDRFELEYDRSRAFAEVWGCATSEARRALIILALIEKGQLSEDASAEELADRHLTLETFTVKQLLTQREMELEWEAQDLAEWLAGQAEA